MTKMKKLCSILKESIVLNFFSFFKAHIEQLMVELEETKTTHKSTAVILDERTKELRETLKDLETTRVQVLTVQIEVAKLSEELEKSLCSLDSANKENSELESQIVCLRKNLANLEDAQIQAVQEREEHQRREEEMDEQIKKIEQILEQELEQFENLVKAKDDEVSFKIISLFISVLHSRV